MSNADNLVEAVLELKWGQISQQEFQFSPEDQTLLAGEISASAQSKNFRHLELLNQQLFSVPNLPWMVTHRFREKVDSWPCIQVGLGVFTINQISNGYQWNSFKDGIKKGLDIFNSSRLNRLTQIANTAVVRLMFQNAFYFDSTISVVDFIEENFDMKVGFSDNFLKKHEMNKIDYMVNLNFTIKSSKPKGLVTITIANANINKNDGLLVNLSIDLISDGDSSNFTIDYIMEWAENAHTILKNSYQEHFKIKDKR